MDEVIKNLYQKSYTLAKRIIGFIIEKENVTVIKH
jgi:hypothetical protein